MAKCCLLQPRLTQSPQQPRPAAIGGMKTGARITGSNLPTAFFPPPTLYFSPTFLSSLCLREGSVLLQGPVSPFCSDPRPCCLLQEVSAVIPLLPSAGSSCQHVNVTQNLWAETLIGPCHLPPTACFSLPFTRASPHPLLTLHFLPPCPSGQRSSPGQAQGASLLSH